MNSRVFCLLLTSTFVPIPSVVPAAEIEFVEDFVFSQDRDQAIEQLIPGSDIYYYYQCIHLQNTERHEQVTSLLARWQKRHGETEHFREIRNRQMLLTYSMNPKRTLDYLIQQLRPNLSHRRDQVDTKPALPSALDQNRITYKALKKAALQRHRGLKGFSDTGLERLSSTDLNAMRRRELLSRLTRPTHPELVELILADLAHKDSRGFGSLGIHRQLLLRQLDELARRRPQVKNEAAFVNTYLQKLQPNPDVDWKNDTTELGSYLSRAWKFASTLHDTHNSLKAHILYHQLVLDEMEGTYNKDRFLQYLALPRPIHYVQPRMLRDPVARRHPVNLSLNPGNGTRLPPIQNDEPLVRRYLLHFLQGDSTYQAYEPFVLDTYLRHAFAEAKITAGLGDPEKWYSLLPPAKYQALKNRVDLDFVPTNPRVFGAEDPVQLDLYVKNVNKLIVKVYEVNTRNYYQQYEREVNTDIALDGLIANHETVYDYEDAPEVRRRRHFEFQQLQQPGVYVIDFIGNGKSSRVVVRKGRLHYLVKTRADGYAFTILDDDLNKVDDASLWMAGHEFRATDDGVILVPFSTAPGAQSFVITHGNLSSYHRFEHGRADHELHVAAHIDREALIPQQEAVVLLRPEVRIGGIPVSLEILDAVRATVRSTNLDGTTSEMVYDNVKLTSTRETPLVFLVPDRLQTIQVELSAQIDDQLGKTHSVQASHQVAINQIDKTNQIEDLHLTKLDDSYILQLLGKTGEEKPHRAIHLTVRHHCFADTFNISLATDEHGIVDLGPLHGITDIAARGPGTTQKTWLLVNDRRTQSRSIHAQVGEIIRIPHMRQRQGVKKTDVSLIELRGNSYAVDVSSMVRIREHFVEVGDLKPGDYSLKLLEDQIGIRVTAGKDESGFLVGSARRLERRRLQPLHVTQLAVDEDKLTIQLENASEFTRVHVYASRFMPSFNAFRAFSSVHEVEPLMMQTPAQRSYYKAGRKLGDELQYVLERAYLTKYPGSMLGRPTLLLNSWLVRDTEASSRTAQEGDQFGPAAPSADMAVSVREEQAQHRSGGLTDFASLDFLAEPTMLVANQRPNGQGHLSISLEELGQHHHFHVVAVDPLSTVYRSIALPQVKTPNRDLRLKRGLHPKKHYTQQKTVDYLATGETLEIADITTDRFETYTDLGDVYSLFVTLSRNKVLEQFDFIVDWPSLSSDEKKRKCSEFACHELNFFLFNKDRGFFTDVIKPYLANKLHKTFLDLWLLNADLDPFLEPWEYSQLNTAERLLLGERINGERARARRLVEDIFDVIPTDLSRRNAWFEAAIQGKVLDNAARFGLVQQRRELLLDTLKEMRNSGMGDRGLGAAARLPQKSAAGIAVEESKVLNERLKESKLRRQRKQDRRYVELDDEVADADHMFFDQPLTTRRRLYETLEKTREWAENNYYHVPIREQNADLVEVNAFWRDYARRAADEPFFSENWPAATRNFSEMMLALSLLDLPFQADEPVTEYANQQLTLSATGPTIVFQEQIREAKDWEKDSSVLLSQNFFRADDRHEMVRGKRRDKFVSDEFLKHVVYGCQIVLTNPTSSRRKVQLLLQIPHQSLPTNGGKATKTIDLEMDPYHTQSVDYFFYFPASGEYEHFPAHVSNGETLLASASPKTLMVVDKPTRVDQQSWDYVSQFASSGEVLRYLDRHNVLQLDLERIAFRMKEKSFFVEALKRLADRHVYTPELWAYALKHNVPGAIATYLKQHPNFLDSCGHTLESELVHSDPVKRKTYQHLDYKPLVNARAHRLGGRRHILNDRFHAQYHELLHVLKYRRNLTSEDRIALTYYLLLQDRIEEAMEMFAGVERSNLGTQVQYDYFAAYLDCLTDQPRVAPAIVARYVDYSVPKWQKAFVNIGNMLDEASHGELTLVDSMDRNQAQTAAAAAQASFDFVVEDKRIRIDYQNLADVQINYYLIDLELLFSSSPFVREFSGQFSHIRPNEIQHASLPEDRSSYTLELPTHFYNRNLLVELVANGITRSRPYFSNSLAVQISDNFGQLKVVDAASGKPVPKTYIKAYAEMQDGRTLFYKDGYTDLRGRFDYSSLSTNELDFVKRFSLLILDETRGGLVREAQPPKR